MGRVARGLQTGRAVALGLLAAACFLGAAGLGQAWAQSAPAPADGETLILDMKNTCWRWFKTWRPGIVLTEGAGRVTFRDRQLDPKVADKLDVDIPAGFAAADFDDSSWPREMGRLMEGLVYSIQGDLANAVQIYRGRFNVNDPAAVKSLTVDMTYRGGVVVYLNGREVKRAHLPEGALAPTAAATPYPNEVYVDAAGKLLPAGRNVKPENKEVYDLVIKRDRALDKLALPVKGLKAGGNVLVIEIRRADYQPAVNKTFIKDAPGMWTHGAMLDVRLTAAGGGIAPNVARPQGVQMWNQDRTDRTTVLDYGDPNEPLRAMKLTGARNGVYSAKVVVSSDKAMDKVEAAPGEFRQVGGQGVIPASALEVRYSVASPAVLAYYTSPWVEATSANPPEKVAPPKDPKEAGAVQPVWLAVRVPKDAAPGEYKGTLAVSVAGGKLADVPVALHVSDWTVPDPGQFRTFVGMYESPTSVAAQYKVEEWTDKHWELLEKSMQLLGQLGTQMVDVPVVDEAKPGNLEGMVRWVKKADGTFDYDFSIVERYLKLVKKHVGVPKFVVFYVWHGGGWSQPGPKQPNTVTVVTADGRREHMQVPEFGTEEGKAFWSPVFKGLKERLAKEGMEKSFCLGNLAEGYIPQEPVNKMLAELLGDDFPWLMITHRIMGSLDRPYPAQKGGGRIGYHIYTYLNPLPEATSPDQVPPLHKPYWPRIAYYRRAIFQGQSLINHRYYGLHALFLRLPGFSHMGLDLWPSLGQPGRSGRPIYGQYPRSGGYPGAPEPYFITWPGPNGAEPMTAYEALREGLQETEALIVLSEAADTAADKLGPELVARCRQVILDELNYLRTRDQQRYQYVFFHMNHYGWQEMSGRVYDLAAEVSRKLAGK